MKPDFDGCTRPQVLRQRKLQNERCSESTYILSPSLLEPRRLDLEHSRQTPDVGHHVHSVGASGLSPEAPTESPMTRSPIMVLIKSLYVTSY